MSDSPLYESNEVEFPWEGRILVVANLQYDVRPTDLRDFFLPRGKIYRVDIERNKKGESNGLAFIEFASQADCEAAAELNGTENQGRRLKCKVSTKPPAELLRYYIRDINKRQVNDRVRQRIIEETINGKPDPTPIVKRERKSRVYKKERRNNDAKEYSHYSSDNSDYSDYSDSYYGYSDSYSYSDGY